MGREVTGITYKAADLLLNHPWPGNIRERQNVIEYAIALSNGDKNDVDDLPSQLRRTGVHSLDPSRNRSLREIEQEYITTMLTACGHNKMHTAKRLDISIATLYRKLKEYGTAES